MSQSEGKIVLNFRVSLTFSHRFTHYFVEFCHLREQRWRVDGKGRMVHKASNQLLALLPRGRVEMRSFREADREVLLVWSIQWKIDCTRHIFLGLEVQVFGSNKDRWLLCPVHPLAGHASVGLSIIIMWYNLLASPAYIMLMLGGLILPQLISEEATSVI